MEELGLELETGYTPGVFGPKETQVHITVGDARMREADVPVRVASATSVPYEETDDGSLRIPQDLEKEARIKAREESAKRFWEAETAKQQVRPRGDDQPTACPPYPTKPSGIHQRAALALQDLKLKRLEKKMKAKQMARAVRACALLQWRVRPLPSVNTAPQLQMCRRNERRGRGKKKRWRHLASRLLFT